MAVERDEMEEKCEEVTTSQGELEERLRHLQDSISSLRKQASSPTGMTKLAEVTQGKSLVETELEKIQSQITSASSGSDVTTDSKTELSTQLQVNTSNFIHSMFLRTLQWYIVDRIWSVTVSGIKEEYQ